MNLIPEAAYVNHGIRESGILAEEDRRIAALCSSLGIPLFTKHLAPGFLLWYAARKGVGTEAAAREFRYHFLNGLLEKRGGEGRLALGHNRNDQEETMAMRLFSGSGLQGLRGIPRSPGKIIRPLIDMDRLLIEAYLRETGINAVEDESNRENEYLRNRVRNRVLPSVREVFPGAGEALRSLGSSLNEVLDHYESPSGGALPLASGGGSPFLFAGGLSLSAACEPEDGLPWRRGTGFSGASGAGKGEKESLPHF